jgi:hypothetical protein
MIKNLTYKFETDKFSGYKLLVEKGIFASFKRINYKGFKINYSCSDLIQYQIEPQLIRKLKLKKLNDEIKINSMEDRLFQLLERSKETLDTESFSYFYWFDDSDIKFEIHDKFERKQRERNLDSVSKNRFKQYNKFRR